MVTILGGGISGLSAAHYLLKRNLVPADAISILEAASHVGGWMKSTQRPNQVIYEHGPRTIRPKGEQGANTLELIEELGLSDQVKAIRFGHPVTVNRLVYVNKRLYKLPSNISSLIWKQEPFKNPLIFSAYKFLTSQRKVCPDESIYDFVARRFGKDIAEYAISPLICGICAGDAKEISVKFLMRSLFEAEQNQSSIMKGLYRNVFSKKKTQNRVYSRLVSVAQKERWNVWSLEGGLQVLPRTLGESLVNRGVSMNLNTLCKSISFRDGKVKVKTELNEFISDHVISSLPSFKLSTLLRHEHPTLSDELLKIPYVTVGVVNLTFPTNILKEKAFGFLVPPSQKLPILGIVYDSCCFPPSEDCTVLTVMLGGSFLQEHFGKVLHAGVALETAIRYSKEILGIKEDPCDHQVSILEKCIPQYVVGHDETIARINDYISAHKLPLTVVGASSGGVGVNDVIISSKRAVENLKNVR